MAEPDDRFSQTLSELVNALQTALVIAQRLAPEAQVLRDTVERAARAASELCRGHEPE